MLDSRSFFFSSLSASTFPLSSYGPMGRTVIVSTVTYGLNFLSQEQKFHQTLREYISAKLMDPKTQSPNYWISLSSTAPLALTQLFECVFAPYIAELLIAQDLRLDLRQALVIRERSKLYREVVIDANTDDGLLDEIIRGIIHSPREAREASPFRPCNIFLNVHLGLQSVYFES